MKMKLKTLFTILMVSFATIIYAQKSGESTFHGAEAKLKSYKALYVLNQSDAKKMHMMLKNINNALNDPRLKGKLQVELLAFGDGTELYRKTNHYDTLLLALKNKGVILAQCENTVRERHINKDDLWPFISYVPSASGEIIIRQSQGWAVVHP